MWGKCFSKQHEILYFILCCVVMTEMGVVEMGSLECFAVKLCTYYESGNEKYYMADVSEMKNIN